MVSQNLPPIRACLFDMDGLLIDSEDIYTTITNTVLHEYGKPDLPWNIKAQLQGRPAPQSQEIFNNWAQLPISREEFAKKVAALQKEKFPGCQPLPGVLDLLQTLTDAHVDIALATSSHSGNYDLKTSHLPNLTSFFNLENIVKGDDKRIKPGRGKPAPDIFLLALETINTRLRRDGKREIKPEECLVFEDSVPGVEAGRRAGMQVVWCPHPGLLQEYKGREEEVLAGLTGEHKEDEAEVLAEKAEKTIDMQKKGQPGEIGDGYARLLKTLEGFPYQDYGIKVAGVTL